MDFGYLMRLDFYQKLGLSQALVDPIEDFHREVNDWNRSNSTCRHLDAGWFVIYDFPLAEQWARELGQLDKIPHFSDHHLAQFSDLQVAMEYKLRWC